MSSPTGVFRQLMFSRRDASDNEYGLHPSYGSCAYNAETTLCIRWRSGSSTTLIDLVYDCYGWRHTLRKYFLRTSYHAATTSSTAMHHHSGCRCVRRTADTCCRRISVDCLDSIDEQTLDLHAADLRLLLVQRTLSERYRCR